MKNWILACLLLLVAPLHATTYYLAPSSLGGSDSNNGTSSGTPWLSPNHAVNCGDVIIAAASSAYSQFNFATGKWGIVTCGAGNNVAWLTCVTFDACKMTATVNNGFWVDQSYWGIQGWEVTASGSAIGCFTAKPNFNTPVEIHHIIFANNVANGCTQSGFGSSNGSTSASVDYFAIIGDVAYNAAQGSTVCGSGISIYQPISSDSLPGTHIFIAGNFSYDNLNPNPCNSGTPTDGEGIILDTLDGGQGGLPSPYSQQVTVENNLVFLNGGRGIWISGHGNTAAPVYILHNTVYGDNGDPNQSLYYCADIEYGGNVGTVLSQAAYNIAAANTNTGCGGKSAVYAFSVLSSPGAGNVVYNNWIYGIGGDNTIAVSSGGFTFGPNNTAGTSPAFVSVSDPGAPSCGLATSVPNCMASVIAQFVPTTTAAKAYGYNTPLTTSIYDPLYPQWLCSVTNLPTGLVTPGCVPPAPALGMFAEDWISCKAPQTARKDSIMSMEAQDATTWVSTATSASSAFATTSVVHVNAGIQNGSTGGTLTLDYANSAAAGTIAAQANAWCKLEQVN